MAQSNLYVSGATPFGVVGTGGARIHLLVSEVEETQQLDCDGTLYGGSNLMFRDSSEVEMHHFTSTASPLAGLHLLDGITYRIEHGDVTNSLIGIVFDGDTGTVVDPCVNDVRVSGNVRDVQGIASVPSVDCLLAEELADPDDDGSDCEPPVSACADVPFDAP